MPSLSRAEIQGEQRYYFPPHISVCALDDGLIVLNQKRRRYLSLPGACAMALAAVSADWPSATAAGHTLTMSGHDTSAALAMLVKHGILTRNPKGGTRIRPSRVTVSENIDYGWGSEQAASPRLRHALILIAAIARASIMLRLVPFDRLIVRVRERREAHQSRVMRDFAEIASLVVQFRRLRPLTYSSLDVCLFDSLVLLEFMAMHSVYPMWVIGVRSRPFLAHSWVQHGHCLLSGTVGYIEQFTPILVA